MPINGLLLSNKSNKLLIKGTTWMDLEILAEERQSQIFTYCMIPFV